jgi:hypothetical protein
MSASDYVYVNASSTQALSLCIHSLAFSCLSAVPHSAFLTFSGKSESCRDLTVKDMASAGHAPVFIFLLQGIAIAQAGMVSRYAAFLSGALHSKIHLDKYLEREL